MLTIAALLERRRQLADEPILQLLGAGPLAGLMAAARLELGREQSSSREAATNAAQTKAKRRP